MRTSGEDSLRLERFEREPIHSNLADVADGRSQQAIGRGVHPGLSGPKPVGKES